VIHLRFFGHIRSSLGSEEMDVQRESMSVDDLFGLLLSGAPAGTAHGFSKYNTLLVVNDGEVVSPSAQRRMVIRDGDSVTLVPFSHGG